MLPHPGKERSARRAGLTGGTGLRRNFFAASVEDNFQLGRCSAVSGLMNALDFGCIALVSTIGPS
jgi:hypothetical protein